MNQRVLPMGDLPQPAGTTVDLPVPSSALAIAAHPDDAEFGCGATLAKWAAGGCRIHHLVLTDGSKGSWEEDDALELVRQRHAEQVEAARRLGGGDVDFLDLPDCELASGLVERRAVCEVIRRVRPQVVLGHDPWRRYRLHPDHRHAGWLATDAVVAAREPRFAPELGSAHRPSTLLLWEADEPNHVEEAGARTLSTKLSALLAHTSQYRSTMGIEPDDGGRQGAEQLRERLEQQMAAHGALARPPVALGEAFRLVTDL